MYCLIIALVDFPVTSSRELGASFKGSEELCSTQLDISTQRAHLGHGGSTDTAEKQVIQFGGTRLTHRRQWKAASAGFQAGIPQAAALAAVPAAVICNTATCPQQAGVGGMNPPPK